MRNANEILETTDVTENCLSRERKASRLVSQNPRKAWEPVTLETENWLRMAKKSGWTPRCLLQLLQETGCLLSGGDELSRLWTQTGSWTRRRKWGG